MFMQRVLELPAVAETVDLAEGIYVKTKKSNEFVGNALKATEDGIWRAAEGSLPLATNMTTPLVNTVGGWTKLDEWACQGLDRVEKVAPIIKRPTKEIASTTRHFILSVVAGDLKANPKNFQIALRTGMDNRVALVTNSQVYKITANFAEQSLDNIHLFVLRYHTPKKENADAWKKGGVMLKTLLLVQEVGDLLYAVIVQQSLPALQDRANKTQARVGKAAGGLINRMQDK